MDARLPFDETVTRFLDFLASQGWSRSLLWLTRDRLAGHLGEYWVYRPEELQNSTTARSWYEDARKEDWNLRIDGFAQHAGSTLAYVVRGPGRSRSLNFGVLAGEVRLHIVHSPLRWRACRILCLLRGESPMLLYTDVPPRAEPNASPNAAPPHR